MNSGNARDVTNKATLGAKQIIKTVQMTTKDLDVLISFGLPEFLLDCFAASFRHSKFCLSLTTRSVVETRTTKKQMKNGAEKELMK